MPRYQWAVFEADLDPVRGSEQRGRRPVLVVSDEDFNVAIPRVTVLPLTSTERRSNDCAALRSADSCVCWVFMFGSFPSFEAFVVFILRRRKTKRRGKERRA